MAEKLPPATAMDPIRKAELYADISRLVELQNKIAEYGAEEKELRLSMAERFFAQTEEGTTTLPLEFGKALKLTQTYSRSVDAEQLDAVRKDAISRQDGDLVTAIDTIFTYKPSVSVTQWKAAESRIRIALADVVTEKPGMPQLKLETPKR